MRLSIKLGFFLFIQYLMSQQVFQPIVAMDFEPIQREPISPSFSEIYLNTVRFEVALFGDPELLDTQDEDGNTLLHHLAMGGRLILADTKMIHNSTALYQFLETLLSHQPNILIYNKHDLTPLHLAAACSHEKVSERILCYLLKYAMQEAINPNPSNKNGVTPLHLAAVNGHRNLNFSDFSVKYFLNLKTDGDQSPIDIDVKTKKGETPLQWAVRSNGRSSCRGNSNLLIKAGADSTCLDERPREEPSPLNLFFEKLKGLFNPSELDKII